jgi:hypothetical protein
LSPAERAQDAGRQLEHGIPRKTYADNLPTRNVLPAPQGRTTPLLQTTAVPNEPRSTNTRAVEKPPVKAPPTRPLQEPQLGASIEPDDRALREKVQTALLRETRLPYTARLVRVKVNGGSITLQGEVNTYWERRLVEEVVDRVRGEHALTNALSVRNRALEATPRSETARAP